MTGKRARALPAEHRAAAAQPPTATTPPWDDPDLETPFLNSIDGPPDDQEDNLISVSPSFGSWHQQPPQQQAAEPPAGVYCPRTHHPAAGGAFEVYPSNAEALPPGIPMFDPAPEPALYMRGAATEAAATGVDPDTPVSSGAQTPLYKLALGSSLRTLRSMHKIGSRIGSAISLKSLMGSTLYDYVFRRRVSERHKRVMMHADTIDWMADDAEHDAEVAGKCSTTAATVNFAMTLMGCGIMALPHVFCTTGIALGLGGMGLAYLLTVSSCSIIVQASAASGISSYAGLVKAEFGYVGATILQLSIVLNNMGVMVVYIIMVADLVVGQAPTFTGLLPSALGMHLDPPPWWLTRWFWITISAACIEGPLLYLRSGGSRGGRSSPGQARKLLVLARPPADRVECPGGIVHLGGGAAGGAAGVHLALQRATN